MFKYLALLLTLFCLAKVNAQSYTTASLSGFNADVIANGVGTASSSITNDLGSTRALVSSNFQAVSGNAAPAYSVPNSGVISSVSTTGLTFQLAPYSGNNALRLTNQNQSGTLTLNTPISGTTVYVLALGSEHNGTMNVKVNFGDGSSQSFNGLAINDWYNASTVNLATNGIGRVNITNNALEGSATTPHFYQFPLTLNSSNFSKTITGITVTKTDATQGASPGGAIISVFAATIDVSTPAACVAPTAQPTALTLTGTFTNVTGSFTASSPAANKYLVLRTVGATGPSVQPVNGVQYNAGDVIGNATVVSSSVTTSFIDNSIVSGTNYTYTVYGFNGVACSNAAYNTTAPLQGTVTAPAIPTPVVSGDTLWVQAQNNIQLDNYNNFDVPVIFPSDTISFRKIIMVFTLGKYQCPPGSQYCGDWDYTIQNFVMTPTDTFELARLVTPYANAGAPRTPWTWTQRYYYDVTDFYPLLKDSAFMRLMYQGYSGGFTANIRFAFIKGTPPRNVKGIKRLWHGSFAYGSTADPIENHFPAVPTTVPAGSQSADLKFTVTGHGSDGSNCSEFCTKYYQVYNGSTFLEQKLIWRDNCGLNNLYPQSGTWIYNRANWCPGDLIYPNVHSFGTVTGGNVINPDINFQTYGGSGAASYTTEGDLFFYGAYNHTTDASLERIISPSNYEADFRANPSCDQPQVKVKNLGGTTISTITFQYGVAGYPTQAYTATGLNLAPMAEADVSLPSVATLNTMTTSNSATFQVIISQVNGAADNYSKNDTLSTAFVTAANWPSQFAVTIRSNNNFTETTWKIENMSGTVMAQRIPTAAVTTYTDQVGALPPGCYKLTVSDAGCDGLYWWANSSSTGIGALYVRSQDLSTFIPFSNGLPTPYYSGSNVIIPLYSQDFGCGFVQYFRVSTATAVTTPPVVANDMSVSPNPFSTQMNVAVTVTRGGKIELQLVDMEGRVAYRTTLIAQPGANMLLMNVPAKIAAGVYVLKAQLNGQAFSQKVVKVGE